MHDPELLLIALCDIGSTDLERPNGDLHQGERRRDALQSTARNLEKDRISKVSEVRVLLELVDEWSSIDPDQSVRLQVVL